GVIIFYIILIGAYIKVGNKFNHREKKLSLVFFSSFLLLILLATVTFLHFGTIIKFLIASPGGWAFRSPLKWQLYIPIAIFGLLVLVLKYVRGYSKSYLIFSGLTVSFLLMNSYLFVDTYKRLLMPHSIQHFSTLQNMDLDHMNILFVNDTRCLAYAQKNSKILTELNQILISKNLQLKQITLE